jgi:hypothetical protein
MNGSREPADRGAARARGVSFVIVTHDSWDFLEGLLPTIPPSVEGLPFEAIVVDSGSTKPPPAGLMDRIGELGCLIPSTNRGFGAANNVGARAASFDSLFFLNPDTVLMPGCAARLFEAIETERGGIIVGPSILLPGGGEQASAFPLPSLAGDAVRVAFPARLFRLLGAKPREGRRRKACGYLSGAAFMMSAAAFERIGGFDERFFLYHEETDLFARARGHGIQALFCPEARVVHWGGGSTGGSDFSIRHSYRSFLLYRELHYGAASLAFARALILAEMRLKIAALSAVSLVRPAWSRRRRLYKRLSLEIKTHGSPLGR